MVVCAGSRYDYVLGDAVHARAHDESFEREHEEVVRVIAEDEMAAREGQAAREGHRRAAHPELTTATVDASTDACGCTSQSALAKCLGASSSCVV